MDNEGLMIFIFQAIIALFAFFVVAPCVLNAVSLFTVQKRFARTMIDLGVVQADVVRKLHPKKSSSPWWWWRPLATACGGRPPSAICPAACPWWWAF